MNSQIRIESKFLLSGNNLKLFAVSFFSIIFRALLLSAIPLLFYFLFFFDNGKDIFITENQYFSLTLKALICSTLSLSSIYLIFSIKICEKYIYFTASKGVKPKLRLSFRKATPKLVLKSFLLHIKIFILKLFWSVFYALPWSICLTILTYMHTKSALPHSIFIVLSFGTSLLFSLCLFMYKATVFRYTPAIYYLLFNEKENISNAIKKSVESTDKYIQNALLLKASLIGWVLSCLLIIPIPYVLPYYKLCSTAFLRYCLSGKTAPQETKGYAINYLRLERNQESI